MNRREFCRKMAIAGGSLALSPLVEACTRAATPSPLPEPTAADVSQPAATLPPTTAPESDPTSTPTPAASATPAVTEYAPQEMTHIALVKTTDRVGGMHRAMDLLGINPVSGTDVLLKPNFNTGDPPPAATDPELLRALVVRLYDMGALSIHLAERSGQAVTSAAIAQKGVFAMAEELGFGVTDLTGLEDKDWVRQHSPDFHWRNGFLVPRMLLDAGSVVQTCNLKTHQYGGHFTMSLKNAVGYVPYEARETGGQRQSFMDELHTSAYQRSMIAEINTAYSPALIVLDGVKAFKSGGPSQGTVADTGVMLAGVDRVAIDAVGVAILRMVGTTPEVSAGRVFEQEQIARAVELGLGVDTPEKITFITDDAESAAYADQIREVLMS